jgi:hypothetical protein
MDKDKETKVIELLKKSIEKMDYFEVKKMEQTIDYTSDGVESVINELLKDLLHMHRMKVLGESSVTQNQNNALGNNRPGLFYIALTKEQRDVLTNTLRS